MISKQFSVFTVLVFITAFIGMALVLLGLLPAVIFSVASIGGFVLWMATTYKTPIDTQKIIVPYLLTIIFFIAHVYEEYLTDFEVAITDITGFHMLERNFLTVAAFVAPIIWITGAILLIKRTHIGFYFLSFFYVAMVFAELSHFIFPFHKIAVLVRDAQPCTPATLVWPLSDLSIRRIRNISKAEIS